MTTILDLHEAHRAFAAVLPGEAFQASLALLVVGQSQDERKVDTWTWPRDPESPAGYSRRTLGRYAGGVGPESIRRGLRLCEKLGLVKTQHRNWKAPQYTLLPKGWLELADQAEKRPAELLARVEGLGVGELRSTVRRTLSHMLARVDHAVTRAMLRAEAAFVEQVTPPASSPADVTPASLPDWLTVWAGRNKVDPACAWSAILPALTVLHPADAPEEMGDLGLKLLARWKARGRPSGTDFGAEVGLMVKAMNAGVKAFRSVEARVIKKGFGSLIHSPSYDYMKVAARRWRDAEGAPALPTAPTVGASGLTRSQALDQAIAELGLESGGDWTMDQITQLDRRVEALLAAQGPAPPS